MEALNNIYKEMSDSGVILRSGVFNFKGNCDSVLICKNSQYGVFLDIEKIRTLAEEKEAVSHEWAHIKTGAVYSLNTSLEVKAKAENRALKYQIRTLIPKDKLDSAISNGYTETWELAEYFNV